jgi:hypothetical protein
VPSITVNAILTWGDVRHTKNQPYNFQSGASGQGMYPRDAQQLVNLNKYTNVWHDYCVATDQVCAGGWDMPHHDSYFDIFSDTAAEWVQKQVIKTGAKAIPQPDKKRSLLGEEVPAADPTSTDAGVMTIMPKFIFSSHASSLPTSSPPPSHFPTLMILPEATEIATRNLSATPFVSGPRHKSAYIAGHNSSHKISHAPSHTNGHHSMHSFSPKSVHFSRSQSSPTSSPISNGAAATQLAALRLAVMATLGALLL